MKRWDTSSLEGKLWQTETVLKCRDIILPAKVQIVKATVFSSSHVQMWGTIKKAEHQRVNTFQLLLEKAIDSPLDCKELKPVHPKGNQSWIFIGRTDAEAEAPILWPPDAKNWLISKDPDAGKGWRQEEKGAREDEMVGRHHRHNGCEFEQAPGVGDGQGGLASCSPRGRKESDATEGLNCTLDRRGLKG